MKRAENVVSAKLRHITFRDDSLVFEFAKSKGHQTGEEVLGPWHCYANPVEPHICPVLAFARYLFCYPEKINENASLLSGGAQYKRYSNILLKVVSHMESQLESQGLSKEDIGTHSIRKGVTSMVASGSTVGPPLMSVILRAGWVLNGVLMRYLKYESAGDEYVGRVASGLDLLTTEFSLSPPYFDYSTISDSIERIQVRERVMQWLKQRIPQACNGSVLDLVFMCFASICYHFEVLERDLHPQNILRSSAFFKDIPTEFKQLIRTSLPWTKTAYTPKITGIPPHILILAELEMLKRSFSSLRVDIRTDIADALSNTGTFQAAVVLRAIEDSGRRIESLLISQRPAPSSDDDFGVDMTGFVDDENDLLNEHVVPPDASSEVILELDQKKAEKIRVATKKRKFKVGVVKDKLHVLSVGFVFPSLTVWALCQNWFFGSLSSNIPPYFFLSKDTGHLSQVKNGAKTIRMMRAVMGVIENVARSKNLWKPRVKDWNSESLKEMWAVVGPVIYERFFGDGRRNVELKWKTLYKDVEDEGFR